jgi:tetratricopeptide (TPR) repeat protein
MGSSERKKIEEALNILFDLVDKFPGFQLGYLYLCDGLRDIGRLDEASRYAKIAVEILPKSKMASLLLFHTFWDMEEYQFALDEIKRFKSIKGKLKDYDEIISELLQEKLIDDELNWLEY